MEEYLTIAEAARRLGINTKRIQRAIKAGDLAARYKYTNKAEISTKDLEAWHASLHLRPGETQDKLTELETRVAALETETQELRRQLEVSRPAKKTPKANEAPPEGFTYLSDFASQHFIPYQAAADLFPQMIRGQNIKSGRRLHPAIGPKGRRDFWVQLHIDPSFRACDDCPHPVE